MSEVQEAFYRLAPHILEAQAAEDGTIEFAGRRFVYFHTPMFSRLFQNMQDVAGPIIDRKIKEFGTDAGKRIASNMDDEFEDVNIRDALSILKDSGFDIGAVRQLGKTDNLSQIQKIFGYGRHVGWVGKVEILEYQDGQKLRFTTENTFEAASYGETGEKECKFLTGVVKGMMTHFWETDELTAEEKQCVCEGNSKCTMVVEHDDGT